MSGHLQSCAITKSNNDFSGKRANEDLEYTLRTPITVKLNDYVVDEDDIASSSDTSQSNCSFDDSSHKVVDVHHPPPPHSLTIKDSLENILKIHKIEVSTRRDFLRLIRYSRLYEYKRNHQFDDIPKNDEKRLMCNLTRRKNIVDNVFQRKLLCAKEKIAFPESHLNSIHRSNLRFPRLKFHLKPSRMNSRRCAVMHNISNLMENLRLDHSSGDDNKMIALFNNKCKFSKRSVQWKSEVDVIYYNGGGGANDSKYKGIDN